MKGIDPETLRATKDLRDRLMQRSLDLAKQCAELILIDPTPSVLSRETGVLSNLTEQLRQAVDSGSMRLESCLRIVECLMDVQQDCLTRRKWQLERHGRQ